jgi:hypothetical protein
MIELKRHNVHRIVDSKKKALDLISDGFKVIEDKDNILGLKNNSDKDADVNQIENINYNSMTVEQLKGICKDKGLEGYSSLSKDDLVKFVQENIKK